VVLVWYVLLTGISASPLPTQSPLSASHSMEDLETSSKLFYNDLSPHTEDSLCIGPDMVSYRAGE